MKPVQPAQKSLAYIIAASSAGTLIEWYDFFIFGSLATIISTEFFPKENPTAAFLATLATFSAGLVVRPLGALFFGRLGDRIGRKYTFMVTLSIMGISTVGMGLVPGYETIGFFAPLIVLILRLLQGLALGGEFGGATTYVAEQSPPHRRGFWTSWIQSTTGVAFILSITVILLIKNTMNEQSWEDWGWRLPFILSVFLVGVSVYVRNKLSESPLFTKAKAEGKTSTNPLKESFGNKANLKIILLAFFGLTLGGGAIGWIGFYAQSFLLKTMFLDYGQANTIIIIGIVTGVPFFFFFGWLSDRIGRKGLMVIGMLIGALAFRPIFENMYQVTNLTHKTEIKTAIQTNSHTYYLPGGDSVVILTTQHFYTDGTISKEITTGDKRNAAVLKSITISTVDKWQLILMIFFLEFIFTLAYGPLAAFMVEMFPLKIRYTSISVPYHFGFGIFGGLAPYFATYLVDKAGEVAKPGYYLAGLNYPILLTMISVIIGLLYVNENNPKHALRLLPSSIINPLRRWMGVVWVLLGLATAWYGFSQMGIPRIFSGVQEDIVFGIIITIIITPVATVGLLLFGKYALQGEYDE